MLSLYSPSNCFGKRRLMLLLPLISLCFSLMSASSAQTAKKIVISHASRVVFSHTGVHTHADYLLFDTGALDLLALQHNPAYPNLAFKAHSSLPTDRAALPPDLAAFSSPGDPPLQNPYGPIDGGPGKPGWSLLPLHQNGKNCVKVLVPTRFVNWLAAQSPARRKQYAQPQRYSLVVTWG